MLTSTAYGDSRLSMWLRVREYAVPPSMIETATSRRLAGDWAGACAAARVDVDLDLRCVARAHGRDLAARVRADLRRLAPDLLRWHMPRIAPDGLLRPGLTLSLARYDTPDRPGRVHLVARTPPGWADAGQRISLAVWDAAHPETGRHPHPHPHRRYRLDLHRHLWDADRAAELRVRSGADGPVPPDHDPLGLAPQGYGCAVGRWAAEAALLLRAEARSTGTFAVRLGGGRRLVLEVARGTQGDPGPAAHRPARERRPDRVDGPHRGPRLRRDVSHPGADPDSGSAPRERRPAATADGDPHRYGHEHHSHPDPTAGDTRTAEPTAREPHAPFGPAAGEAAGLPVLQVVTGPVPGGFSALPVLPDAATWVAPDLELLRAGRLGPDRLHPLVAAALAPGHAPPDPHRAPDPACAARLVECRGALHRIGLVDGVLAALDHDPAEIRREELLFALGGPPLPCLRAVDDAHRRPDCLTGVRERLDHGDTAGALAVVEGLLGPEAVLRDGPLRDELAAAAERRISYGLYRAGLTDPGRAGADPRAARHRRRRSRRATPAR